MLPNAINRTASERCVRARGRVLAGAGGWARSPVSSVGPPLERDAGVGLLIAGVLASPGKVGALAAVGCWGKVSCGVIEDVREDGAGGAKLLREP